jgi:8-oxo-dGTP pyrophosphatase MutT (NUDIX family)
MKIYRLIKNAILSLLGRRTVGARILLVKENKILLVKHTYQNGWYTIGGAVDRGESPLHAIHRELKEEVGVTLTSPPKLFSVYYSKLEKRDDYIVLYLGSDHTQEDVSCNEILSKQWFELDNLPEDVTPATKRRISEYLLQRDISDIW